MEILNVLVDVINENVDHNLSEINQDTLLDSINLDSLDYVAIQVAIRKAIGVALDFDELTNVKPKTIGDLSNYIEELAKLIPA